MPASVILGLVPRTPASAEKKVDPWSGEIAAKTRDGSSADPGVLGTSPRMAGGGVIAQARTLAERERRPHARSMEDRYPWIAVYMLSDRYRGTLYIGVTSDLIKRIHQHREGDFEGFSKRYGLHRLVWFETHGSMSEAIRREKTLKHWVRNWKINLIERDNPCWNDLYDPIVNWTPVPRQV